MERKEHWEGVYGKKAPDGVSWYRPHLDRSLDFVRELGLAPDTPVIDVGGGASTLVDDLLADGLRDVSVLDLSARALAAARERLGEAGERVAWLEADVLRADLPRHRYRLWHDRAVFHFLTRPEDREAYVAQVRHAVAPGGHVIVATFGPAGPEKCSGLPVVRYDAEGIHGEFGGSFVKLGSAEERHETPWGGEQEFVYCFCRKL